MNETLFANQPEADYMKHVKYPNAVLRKWNDLIKSLQEKDYLAKKLRDINNLAETAKQNVLTAHETELAELSESIGKLNMNVNEFLTNHSTDFNGLLKPMDLGDYEIIAETKTKYKIKRKKEAKQNEN